MRAAWTSVQPKFSVVITQIGRPPQNNSQLKERGLVGDELIFKLSIFNQAHDELRDGLVQKNVAQEGVGKRTWRWIRKLWKPTLKSADVILKSLSFIPGAEAISEFKEAAESGLELGLGLDEAVQGQPGGSEK